MEFCCERVASHAAAAAAAASGAAGAAGGGGGGAAAAAPPREELTLACMRLLVAVLSCDAYQGRSPGLSAPRDAAGAERAKGLAAAVSAALGEFWAAPSGGGGGGAPRRAALLRSLVGGLLPLSARDLSEWGENAEAWHHGAEGGAWEDAARPCAEHLYLQLLAVGFFVGACVCVCVCVCVCLCV
jgi:hypothetical protein